MRLLPVLLMLTVALSACGTVETKKIDYKSAQKAPTLEVPPDLVAPAADNRYAIPDTQGGGTATLSTYSQERKTAPSGAETVLPTEEKVRIERAVRHELRDLHDDRRLGRDRVGGYDLGAAELGAPSRCLVALHHACEAHPTRPPSPW